MSEVLSIGRIALVLDYPQQGARPASAPFISTFHAENILDWREQLVDGRQKLTMIRLHENNEDLDDGVEQHLVLSLEGALSGEAQGVASGEGRQEARGSSRTTLADP